MHICRFESGDGQKKEKGLAVFSRIVLLGLIFLCGQWSFGQEKADLPEINMQAPVYLKGGTSRNDYSSVKVTMPVKIGLQGHPRIYMSRAEIVKWREDMKKTERGLAAFNGMAGVAAGAAELKIVHPDPKVPAQAKDRGDPAAKAHNRLSNTAGRLGWAYQLTDNEECAVKAREILVGYAKLYPKDYAEHKGVNGNDTGKIMSAIGHFEPYQFATM